MSPFDGVSAVGEAAWFVGIRATLASGRLLDCGLELMNGQTGTHAHRRYRCYLFCTHPNCPNRAIDSMPRERAAIHQMCMHILASLGFLLEREQFIASDCIHEYRAILNVHVYAYICIYIGISLLRCNSSINSSSSIFSLPLKLPTHNASKWKNLIFRSRYFPPKQDYGLGFVRREPIPNWRTSCFSMGKLSIHSFFFQFFLR